MIHFSMSHIIKNNQSIRLCNKSTMHDTIRHITFDDTCYDMRYPHVHVQFVLLCIVDINM